MAIQPIWNSVSIVGNLNFFVVARPLSVNTPCVSIFNSGGSDTTHTYTLKSLMNGMSGDTAYVEYPSIEYFRWWQWKDGVLVTTKESGNALGLVKIISIDL